MQQFCDYAAKMQLSSYFEFLRTLKHMMCDNAFEKWWNANIVNWNYWEIWRRGPVLAIDRLVFGILNQLYGTNIILNISNEMRQIEQ